MPQIDISKGIDGVFDDSERRRLWNCNENGIDDGTTQRAHSQGDFVLFSVGSTIYGHFVFGYQVSLAENG